MYRRGGFREDLLAERVRRRGRDRRAAGRDRRPPARRAPRAAVRVRSAGAARLALLPELRAGARRRAANGAEDAVRDGPSEARGRDRGRRARRARAAARRARPTSTTASTAASGCRRSTGRRRRAAPRLAAPRRLVSRATGSGSALPTLAGRGRRRRGRDRAHRRRPANGRHDDRRLVDRLPANAARRPSRRRRAAVRARAVAPRRTTGTTATGRELGAERPAHLARDRDGWTIVLVSYPNARGRGAPLADGERAAGAACPRSACSTRRPSRASSPATRRLQRHLRLAGRRRRRPRDRPRDGFRNRLFAGDRPLSAPDERDS